MMQMTIAGTPEAVRQALQDLADDPLFASLSQDLRSSAEIVLAEVLNNIVEHAYADRHGMIALGLDPRDRGLICIVSDTGAPMPDLCLPKGQLQPLGRVEDLPEGGFGWFLIRSLTERLEYHHADGVNHLSFEVKAEQSCT